MNEQTLLQTKLSAWHDIANSYGMVSVELSQSEVDVLRADVKNLYDRIDELKQKVNELKVSLDQSNADWWDLAGQFSALEIENKELKKMLLGMTSYNRRC